MSLTAYLVLMCLWLSFDAALSLVQLANNPSRGPGHAAARALHSGLRLALVVLTVMQLGGCGGGDWPQDDDKVPPPGVDCATRPELCA